MIEKLILAPEEKLGDTCISDHFDASFFQTNFWLMWATTFAFQPWHSVVELRRYMLRFVHMVPGFNRLLGLCAVDGEARQFREQAHWQLLGP